MTIVFPPSMFKGDAFGCESPSCETGDISSIPAPWIHKQSWLTSCSWSERLDFSVIFSSCCSLGCMHVSVSFFSCVIFVTLCVCKQGCKMLSTWSLSKHTLTLAHTQTTAPWWVCGNNGHTGGKQSAEVYREVERGNALWFGLFCDPDSTWKAEGEWWCHYSLPSGATHTLFV